MRFMITDVYPPIPWPYFDSLCVKGKISNQLLNAFDFRIPGVDIILDTPTMEFFYDFYETYPNAKVILTTRNHSEWVARRKREHFAHIPVQRPCGLEMKKFAAEDLAKMLQLHENFVRCMVPKENLLEICITCGNVEGKIIADFLGIDPKNAYMRKMHTGKRRQDVHDPRAFYQEQLDKRR